MNSLDLYVLATGTALNADLTKYQREPDFRKATRNMLLGFAALEPILAKNYCLERAGFVLGSSFGELQATQDFLSAFANQGIARPFLFQHSLYNATLGFLALKLRMRGPSVTTSQRHFTAESSLETASILIHSGACSLCLVVNVDARVLPLEPVIQKTFPEGTTLDEGASALLVCGESYLSRSPHPPIAKIEDIQLREVTHHQTSILRLDQNHYDSNATEKLIDEFSLHPQGLAPQERELFLSKPNGDDSRIRFRLL